jgi:4-hydroxy-tetrahydrodipicolinate synthase
LTELTGTIPALLTPFGVDGEIDFDAMDAHVAWLVERGVRAVSPLGTTGEGPSLSLAERKRVIDHLIASDVSVIPGTGCNALPETIELSRYALERGVAAVLVMPPWYYAASQRGTVEYFRALTAALPAGARVLAYHIPSFTGVAIEDDVLRVPGVAGAKDSGGVLAHTVKWLRDFPEHTILNGSDTAAAAFYEAGGRATLTMLANVFPDRLTAIRDGRDIEEHQTFLMTMRELVETVPRHAALKYLLHRRAGLPHTRVRPPLDELTDEQRAALDAADDLV